ncbi:hypothetical protein EVAR_51510_1 [Eumeta japonica]|uniref:Uncharacterized protein n=1 Tax=Eumeta variegata TaxID=151549 RepID=A0A4C1XFB5_EUMVA|nr:hypothetical protein EVAR_51510_1 [Eumeta japonica]
MTTPQPASRRSQAAGERGITRHARVWITGKAHKNNNTLEELYLPFKDLVSSTQQLVCLCLFAVPRCTCPANRLLQVYLFLLVTDNPKPNQLVATPRPLLSLSQRPHLPPDPLPSPWEAPAPLGGGAAPVRNL